ncbi:dTDP-4-dehydrorhamnose 3,5-epimerase [Phaeocystidibacter luteus]|uniref:dTDP-4-dehydrorhamnose 3,5-epimerase n=1 Tax=Phaeocystidibacter luteus TaxID=911197 RepID=A0A6N6RK98_9FLAO|nr:dTDP-4-dehydrorhamnose 3,5-epimerase [Phaeocystidibacter luteus]KAB2814308.1 dTDP-4-dehydrorhamnose 3,5-epimerase [Phaeocystidibacter luteus]
MKVLSEPLKDCFLLEPTVFGDHRGYFFESFNDVLFEQLTGQNSHFVQDNQSKSSRGVLRGIHMQKGGAAQAKLVRVVAGAVWDVAVDLRPSSPTYKQWFGVELTAENHRMLYVPRGFGHGFVTLEDDTIFTYKCDNHYSVADEIGLMYNDAAIGIQWPIEGMDIKLSEKDGRLMSISELEPHLK